MALELHATLICPWTVEIADEVELKAIEVADEA